MIGEFISLSLILMMFIGVLVRLIRLVRTWSDCLVSGGLHCFMFGERRELQELSALQFIAFFGDAAVFNNFGGGDTARDTPRRVVFCQWGA
jgi:hypothetical protein